MGVLEAIKAALFVVVGILLGWAASFLWFDTITAPAEREAGRIEERIVWQERQREAEAKSEAARRLAQARIDEITRNAAERDQARDAEMAALEAALEKDRTDAPPPALGAACACRPAVPGSLSEQLDRLGRSAPGSDPAGAQAPVPGRL